MASLVCGIAAFGADSGHRIGRGARPRVQRPQGDRAHARARGRGLRNRGNHSRVDRCCGRIPGRVSPHRTPRETQAVRGSALRERTRLSRVISRYSRPAMQAIWSDEGKLARWLEVELAAARRLGGARRRPRRGRRASSARPRVAPSPERVPRSRSARSTTSPRSWTRSPSSSGPAGRWLHYGLTSSDVLDTALALQVRDAGALVLDGIDRALAAVVRRAEEHRATPASAARTASTPSRSPSARSSPAGRSSSTATASGSPARSKGCASASSRARSASTRGGDPEVERLVCERLGLEPEPVATQVVPRDRHAELLSALALVAASLERFATEIRHLARTEVREVQEPFAQRAEGLVRDAAQAEPDRRRAPLRAGARRARGRARRARERGALARARHLALERGAGRPAGRVPRARLHARPFRLARRRARRGRGADAAQPRRVARARLQPARAARARRVRARRATRRTASCSATRCAPGTRSSTSATLVEADPEIAGRLGTERIAAAFDLEDALRHVDVLFERLAALPTRKRRPSIV